MPNYEYLVFAAFLILIAYVISDRKQYIALRLFCSFYLLADVVNSLIFLNNESMYRNSPWGFTGDFSFNFKELIGSYQYSYLIILFIVFFTYLLSNNLNIRGNSSISINLSSKDIYGNSNLIYLSFYLVLSAAVFIYAYQIKLGITGVDGQHKHHLSGVFHYYRSYIAPIVICFFLSRLKIVNYPIIFIIFTYSVISGITSASRFVGIVPIALLIPYLLKRQKFKSSIILGVLVFISWVIVTLSRDLTFSSLELNFFKTLFYSLTNIFDINFYHVLDNFTGRLSGAQQTIVAFQFRGIESCQNILIFFMGRPVCNNIALDLFQLDLTGTSYGIGLSVITSIFIHTSSWYNLIFPAFLIATYIWLSQFTYMRLKDHKISKQYSFYFMGLSIIFLFSGPLLFFYGLVSLAWIFIALISRYKLYDLQ